MNWTIVSGLLGTLISSASALEPYQADPFTLHLWHLDEEAAPFANSSTSQQFPLKGQFNGATSMPSFLPKFGNAVSFHHNAGGSPRMSDLKGAIVTLSPVLDHAMADNAPAGFRCAGNDGAFTFEALIKLNLLPENAEGIALDLITLEEDSDWSKRTEADGDESRGFHFRIERNGFLMFDPLPGSGTQGGAMATIPRSGPHQINTEDWFHVAVCYSGQEGISGNVQLFWTSLANHGQRANLIGSGSLTEDLIETRGDFSIGNEARSITNQSGQKTNNAEAEPFPGLLDEIRISSVARHPTDYFFVEPTQRIGPVQSHAERENRKKSEINTLALRKLWVDGKEHHFSPNSDELVKLSKGNHRLDFDFGFVSNQRNQPMVIRSQLEGFDRVWRKTGQGMALIFQLLDANGAVLSESQHSVLGRSSGWNIGLEDSQLTPWTEPLFVPEGARSIRVKFSSGPPDTTGSMAIDNLEIIFPDSNESIWPNGNFNLGRHRQSRSGLPDDWTRSGSNLAIPQALNTNSNLLIALIDGDQERNGEWQASTEIPSNFHKYRTATVKWTETYNVIEGAQFRSTYLNVTPGEYTFRAMGTVKDGSSTVSNINFSFQIPTPLFDQPWFRPAIIGGSLFLLLLYLLDYRRRLHRRKLRAAEFENRLERDRSRIAGNMHDDLGTRASVINLAASLASKELSRDLHKTSQHLDKVKSSTRELTLAMDELVWAVDPSHDTLEHLASHLIRVSDEVFSGSGIKCRIDVPEHLPPLVFRSEYRHHITLAVKEAFHNVLKHSKATEAKLTLATKGQDLVITISDNGVGFNSASPPDGSGLTNFKHRLREIGGSCDIHSSLEKGTTVTFKSPLSQP